MKGDRGLLELETWDLDSEAGKLEASASNLKLGTCLKRGTWNLKLQTLSVGVQVSTFNSGTPGSTSRVPGFNSETSDSKFQNASFKSRAAGSKLKESNFKIHVPSFTPGPP